MRHRSTILFLLSIALLLAGSVRAQADCWQHPNSHPEEGDLQNGPYCAGTGAGCTDCLDYNPAPGVSYQYCIYDWAIPGDAYCFTDTFPWDYQE
jgi:hypothetical protein